jgi:hypothetical protein
MPTEFVAHPKTQGIRDEGCRQRDESRGPQVPRDRAGQQANGNDRRQSNEGQDEQHEWQLN